MIVQMVSRLRNCGPVNVVSLLTKHLEEDVHVVALSPGDKATAKKFQTIASKVTILDETGSKRLPSLALRFRDIISSKGIDLVHTHGFRPDLLASVVPSSAPTVSTLHSVPQFDYPMGYGRAGYLLAAGHQFVQVGIDRPIAVSESVCDKVPFADTTVYNGVDMSGHVPPSEKQQQRLRDRLDISPAKDVFLYIGRITELKRPMTIIDGFLQSSITEDSILVLVGGGALETECRCRTTDTNSVRVEGHIENVQPYLGAADYFVSGSSTEGLPLSVIEAMASGLPVVLSDIGPHREILRGAGRAGKMFPLEDTSGLSRTLSQVSSLDPRAARRTAKSRFSAERMTTDYAAVYNELF